MTENKYTFDEYKKLFNIDVVKYINKNSSNKQLNFFNYKKDNKKDNKKELIIYHLKKL